VCMLLLLLPLCVLQSCGFFVVWVTNTPSPPLVLVIVKSCAENPSLLRRRRSNNHSICNAEEEEEVLFNVYIAEMWNVIYIEGDMHREK